MVSFGGDDRLVSDYLESEFLSRISRRQRVFLTRTAVLERMCGPLCETVLEMGGAGVLLAELARSKSCCWCHWTGGGSGTATIICSATCCWRS